MASEAADERLYVLGSPRSGAMRLPLRGAGSVPRRSTRRRWGWADAKRLGHGSPTSSSARPARGEAFPDALSGLLAWGQAAPGAETVPKLVNPGSGAAVGTA